MESISTTAFLAAMVFIAGFIDSIAGGGGLITIPAYLIVGIPPALTLGTNKFVSTVGTLVSTSKYALGRRILWPVALVGLPFALGFSSLGAYSVGRLNPAMMRQIILWILPIAAIFTLLRKPKNHREIAVTWGSWRLWVLVPLVTATIGWYDGFFGPGTGSFLLLLLYLVVQLNFLHAAATARFFNLLSNVAAFVTFWWQGQIIYSLGIVLCVFSIAGHYLGSHLALKQGDGLVRWMLGVACAILFGYLWFASA